MSNFFSNIFNGIGHFFHNLFVKAKPFLQKEIPIAIAVVNGLKKVLDTAETQPFKTILDGLAGAGLGGIIAKVDAALPQILMDMGLVRDGIDTGNAEAVLLAALEQIKKVSPDKRWSYYNGIATNLVNALIDKKLSVQELLIIVQKAYQDGVDLHLFNAALPDVSHIPLDQPIPPVTPAPQQNSGNLEKPVF